MAEYKMMLKDYKIMNEAINNFKNNMGRLPNYYDFKTESVRLTKAQYSKAISNVNAFIKKNKRNPNYVMVNATKIKITPKKPALWLALEDALGGSFNTMAEFYKLLMNKPYKYYYNDMYPQKEAIRRLKNTSGLNCADISQLAFAAAVMLKLNPTYWRGKFDCGGHIWITTCGDKYNQNVFDGAAAFKRIKQGEYLCKGSPKELVKNPDWLKSDDGKT